MNKKALAQLERLALKCETTLKGQRQSLDVFRGDMWAIIGANHEIQKARLKRLAAETADPQKETR